MKKLTSIIARSILALTAVTGCSDNILGPNENYHVELVNPNPFTSKTTIEYFVANPGTVNFQLFTVSGNKIMDVNDPTVNQGMNDYQLNVEGLFPDIYLLNFFVDGKNYGTTMIVKE